MKEILAVVVFQPLFYSFKSMAQLGSLCLIGASLLYFAHACTA